MNQSYFLLPLRFSEAELQHDLATCIQYSWKGHFNQNDYTGHWSGLALRSASGRVDDLQANPGETSFRDSPVLAQCPAFSRILEQLDCPKETVRLLSLAPGSIIHEHTDPHMSYGSGVFRLHIPIQSGEEVRFRVDGGEVPMRVGECWYANFERPHSVENQGSIDRIHLVIDCLRNPWSDALFKQAGYDFSAEERARQLPDITKRRMIEELRQMDTDVARQLIRQLEREMALANDPVLTKITSFLTEIGIVLKWAPLTEDTFLPGILIDRGELLVDFEQLLYPGDLLHEAGHIAVTLAEERTLLGGNVTLNNPQKEGDELAVLLWTYAACKQLSLPPSVVFHPAGYKGQSDWLIEQFESGTYIGLPLLVWMGMTASETFPVMKQWLRA